MAFIRKQKKTIPRSGKISRATKTKNNIYISNQKEKNSKKSFDLLALGVPKIRIKMNGELKPTQITQKGKNILNANPTLVKNFLDLLTQVKIKGFAKKNGVVIESFDPHDKSSFHSSLFTLNVKGKKFLVKEVNSPAFPFNPHSQLVLHQKLQKLNLHLKQFNCEVIGYLFAWEGKRTSFLVSPFINGVTLEKYISSNPLGEKSEAFQHFLKSRRILNDRFGIRDVTTRNVIFNSKTGKLTFFDLMPPK